MPVEPATENGKPGYRWGKKGHIYTYTSGDETSRRRAYAKAAKQGRAVEASKHAKD